MEQSLLQHQLQELTQKHEAQGAELLLLQRTVAQLKTALRHVLGGFGAAMDVMVDVQDGEAVGQPSIEGGQEPASAQAADGAGTHQALEHNTMVEPSPPHVVPHVPAAPAHGNGAHGSVPVATFSSTDGSDMGGGHESEEDAAEPVVPAPVDVTFEAARGSAGCSQPGNAASLASDQAEVPVAPSMQQTVAVPQGTTTSVLAAADAAGAEWQEFSEAAAMDEDGLGLAPADVVEVPRRQLRAQDELQRQISVAVAPQAGSVDEEAVAGQRTPPPPPPPPEDLASKPTDMPLLPPQCLFPKNDGESEAMVPGNIAVVRQCC